ncbi:hypothetical protein HYG86_09115 [Alkalicella caledoniensis]|uniref:Uncharacterized protein n=1 Tax=Alkalicella caledoniensis TaxID=2731377 RepID=A0A7G9W8A9_ALKCA|nr:hypothetical protein [Alkalicella caledoniensis]QNO14921.1 hypothetical protein HYG86_09115 [Alkalicella caledoniensis]
MVGAIKRGLTLSDFENLTIGMIIGYITTYNGLDQEESREATQEDIDAFYSR